RAPALEQGGRSLEVPGAHLRATEADERVGGVGDIRTDGLLQDGERARVSRLGLRVLARLELDVTEVREREGDVRVLDPERLLFDDERSLARRDGRRRLSHPGQHEAEV